MKTTDLNYARNIDVDTRKVKPFWKSTTNSVIYIINLEMNNLDFDISEFRSRQNASHNVTKLTSGFNGEL